MSTFNGRKITFLKTYPSYNDDGPSTKDYTYKGLILDSILVSSTQPRQALGGNSINITAYLVEYEDGKVGIVYPDEIKRIDPA